MEYRLIETRGGRLRLFTHDAEQLGMGVFSSVFEAVASLDGPDVVVPVIPTPYGHFIRVVNIPETTTILPVMAYVAGPLRAKTLEEMEENCRVAVAIALRLWDAGIPAICPHMNTDLLVPRRPDGYEKRCDWIGGDLIMVARCDLLVLAPGWEGSVGSLCERKRMMAKGGPVYVDVAQAIAETQARFRTRGGE